MALFRPVPLTRFVYRTLAIRLTLMAALIGLLTGLAVYRVERGNLQALVVEETRSEISLLLQRTQQIIDTTQPDKRSAFHQALRERAAVQLGRESGTYVYVCFFFPDHDDIEERTDPGYDLQDAVMRFVVSRPRTVPPGGEWVETVTIEDQQHVYVVMPLKDAAHNTIAYVQAVFVPSKSVQSAIRDKLQRSVALAVLIVLATSGLLYPVILHLMRKLLVYSANLLEANLETLSLLASAIAKRDSDTDEHNFRVTLYAVRLAEALHRSESEIQSLIKGAFLHDVGKIGIRDHILLKPGGLNEDEFGQMKEHVRHGMEIIHGSNWLSDGAQVVASHHEKFDGSGYPQGLAGTDIPLLARIFAVVDVFDALTSERPYKEPMSYEAAMAKLEQGRGSHFDPEILDAFATIARKLHQSWTGCNGLVLREHLKTVLSRYFSQGVSY